MEIVGVVIGVIGVIVTVLLYCLSKRGYATQKASTVSELLRITKDILDYCLTEEPACCRLMQVSSPESASRLEKFGKKRYDIDVSIVF